MERDRIVEKGLTLKDVLIHSYDMEEDVIERQYGSWVLGLTERLLPIQRDVVMKWYGFETGVPMTVDEIASVSGLSRERIRFVRSLAISNLRRFISIADSEQIKVELNYDEGLKRRQQVMTTG